MSYHVKVSFFGNAIEDLEDDFYAVIIDDNAEYLLLFKDIQNVENPAEKIMRYSIPLNNISTFSVVPHYEDNKPKVPRC